MVPEDLLFWMAPLDQVSVLDVSVLCSRHADAMVVPRGWTLDDRRESVLRLFRPRPAAAKAPPVSPPPQSRRPSRRRPVEVEQLQIDGTGEIPRPATGPVEVASWDPDFDHDDDLDGLLEVTSPLLARAFRGTDRPKR